MKDESNSTNVNQPYDEKLVAIIGYITPIGWVAAYMLNNTQKSQLAFYHLRQSLLMFLIGAVLYVFQVMVLMIPYVGWLINLISAPIGIALLILWIMGIIFAINGEEKPIPFIGDKAQQIFNGIK